MGSPLHADLEPLAFLLGTWRGEGEGDYPTTSPFAYREELVLEHVGDPFLLFTQQSWMIPDHAPLHFERGILRPGGPGRVELALAHPLGLVEVSEGTVEGTSLDLVSRSVSRTSTGDPVVALARSYRVEGDVLRYEIGMATESTPLTFHIRAELRKAL